MCDRHFAQVSLFFPEGDSAFVACLIRNVEGLRLVSLRTQAVQIRPCGICAVALLWDVVPCFAVNVSGSWVCRLSPLAVAGVVCSCVP